MTRFRTLLGTLFFFAIVGAFGASVLGCNPYDPHVVTADAYETCDDLDVCPTGLACLVSTLPASAGFTGAFCSTSCNFATDCPQLIANFDAICVNSLCYIQCPDGGGNCPYGTGCATFADQDGNAVNLCTP
jgi:hypothetical protein